MNHYRFDFTVRRADGGQESLSVRFRGRHAGEATVRYEGATAEIAASVDMKVIPEWEQELEAFHQEFATELMAFVLNRGSCAQDQHGAVTYNLGTRAHCLTLPAPPEMGLGYPNSW